MCLKISYPECKKGQSAVAIRTYKLPQLPPRHERKINGGLIAIFTAWEPNSNININSN